MKALRWLSGAVAALWKAADFDRLDAVLVLGLAALFRGLWLVSEPLAWIACGAVLVGFSFCGVVVAFIRTLRG